MSRDGGATGDPFCLQEWPHSPQKGPAPQHPWERSKKPERKKSPEKCNVFRSCPRKWCSWRSVTALTGIGRVGQPAIAGRLTVGSSLSRPRPGRWVMSSSTSNALRLELPTAPCGPDGPASPRSPLGPGSPRSPLGPGGPGNPRAGLGNLDRRIGGVCA